MEEQEKDVCKDLLIRLIDSRDGYKDAGAHADQERHQKMFGDLANKRHEYSEELRTALASHGCNYETDGTFLAGAHRFFMEIKDKLGGDDESLLESILTGESNLLEQYEDAIEKVKTDTDLLQKLQNQYKEVKSNYKLLEAKEEAA